MVLSAAALGISAGVGRLPARHWLSLLCRAESISADRRQFLYSRSVYRSGRVLAGSDARLPAAVGRGFAFEPGGGHDLHHGRYKHVFPDEPGIVAGDSQRSRSKAADSCSGWSANGGGQFPSAGAHDLLATESGFADQHWRDLKLPGAICLFAIGYRAQSGLFVGRANDGQDARGTWAFVHTFGPLQSHTA